MCNSVANALAKKASSVVGLQVWLEDLLADMISFLNKFPGLWCGISTKKKNNNNNNNLVLIILKILSLYINLHQVVHRTKIILV